MTVTQVQKPWVEKHRPRTVDDLMAPPSVKAAFKRFVETKNLPHMLFYGPPGTGKTSAIMAIARDLYKEEVKTQVLSLNASDERGIAVVRERIKKFAKYAASNTHCRFKLIILDEADSMTSDAQAALRRVMETYSTQTRFCLICNYVTRIIDPLISRCVKFRFRSVSDAFAAEKLRSVSKEEGLDVSEGVVREMVRLCEGDLRRAVMLLQAVSTFGGKQIDEDLVRESAGMIPESFINSFVNALRNPRLDELRTQCESLLAEGYAAATFLSQLMDRAISDNVLTDTQQERLAMAVGDAEARLGEKGDELLALLRMVSMIVEGV